MHGEGQTQLTGDDADVQRSGSEPHYPWALNYHDVCPIGDTCPGFRTFRTRHTVAVFYCHDRVCLEMWTGMLNPCPCERASECRGNHWEKDTQVCNLIQEEGMIRDVERKER